MKRFWVILDKALHPYRTEDGDVWQSWDKGTAVDLLMTLAEGELSTMYLLECVDAARGIAVPSIERIEVEDVPNDVPF